MNLQEVITALSLTVLTDPKDFTSIEPTCGYSSDLLSCVMAGAPHKSIWVTLQAHSNIIAVATLLELSAVIITEGAMPEPPTLAKANEEGVVLLSTDKPTFHVIGKLWDLGFRCETTE
ncbi:MAG: serine kinase [Anaerolinea sp.]|nr:serine kinase [Anaerolinea sp.]